VVERPTIRKILVSGNDDLALDAIEEVVTPYLDDPRIQYLTSAEHLGEHEPADANDA